MWILSADVAKVQLSSDYTASGLIPNHYVEVSLSKMLTYFIDPRQGNFCSLTFLPLQIETL